MLLGGLLGVGLWTKVGDEECVGKPVWEGY